MAKDAEKAAKAEKARKKALDNKKRLDISPVAIIDNMVFSKTEAWAYYKLSNHSYEYLEPEAQGELVLRLTNALNALMQESQEALEIHLINTSVPVDIKLWREQVNATSEDWERAPGYEAYMDQMQDHLLSQEFNQKIVYLGINLGKRGALNLDQLNVFEAGVKGAWEYLTRWVSKALAVPTEDISEDEEKDFRRKEKSYNLTLRTGHFKARKASAEELLLLIKRQLYPAMPTPYLDVDHGSRLGAGDLALETCSVIENTYHYLKLYQQMGSSALNVTGADTYELEGYRATLSLSKFPRYMDFPGGPPYLYLIEKWNFPYTTFGRFTLHPSKKMKLELEKKRKEQRDELENLAGAQDNLSATISGGAPVHVREALEDAQELAEMLEQDKTAWLEGSYFIVVEESTEERLRAAIEMLKQLYSGLEMNLSWTSFDQADLFLSQMPGDRHRMRAFDQMTNLAMLPASGFSFSSEVGDPLIGNENEAV